MLRESSTRFIRKPLPVFGDLGEDTRSARAGTGSERHDTNDIVSTITFGADERATRVTHAGGPSLAGFAEADDVFRWRMLENRDGHGQRGDGRARVGMGKGMDGKG